MGYYNLLNESSYLKGKAKAEQYAAISDILDNLYKEKSEELEGIHKELHFQQLRALT